MRIAALLLAVALLCACGGDDEPPPPPAASARRPDLARLARDTMLPVTRAQAWSAALRAAAAADYRLVWFDARAGTAEVQRDSGLWVVISVPASRTADSAASPTDGPRARVTVTASHTPAHPTPERGRAPARVPDDTALARVEELVRHITRSAAIENGVDLLADSVSVSADRDTVEACRGTGLGEWWVEIDNRRDPSRCATPRLFGIERNVAIMRRVEKLPLFSLVETCADRARVPRGFSVGYSHHDATRCGGRPGAADANVLVLRKMF